MIDLLAPPVQELVTTPAAAFDSTGSECRIDLHVHSHACGFAQNWWVRGLGLGIETRESYTSPDEVWSRARQAGMDFVTLTDHETLDGAIELAQYRQFLPGVEVNAARPAAQNQPPRASPLQPIREINLERVSRVHPALELTLLRCLERTPADLGDGFVRELYRRFMAIAVPSHATAHALRVRGFGERLPSVAGATRRCLPLVAGARPSIHP